MNSGAIGRRTTVAVRRARWVNRRPWLHGGYKHAGASRAPPEIRGKRGVGYCKSMPSAVRPYERLRDRAKPIEGNRRKRTGAWSGAEPPKAESPQPTDPVFPVITSNCSTVSFRERSSSSTAMAIGARLIACATLYVPYGRR